MLKSHWFDYFKEPYRILLFDGVCNFCNRFVNIVMRYDPSVKFKIGALQAVIGQKILREIGLPTNSLHSFILIENGQVWTRSAAVLRVLRHLTGLWPIAYILIIIPRFIRDAAYNLISKSRYRFFGQSNTCRIPSPEERHRFL